MSKKSSVEQGRADKKLDPLSSIPSGKRRVKLTAEQIRLIAGRIEAHARTMHRAADDMDMMGIDTIDSIPAGIVTIVAQKLPVQIRKQITHRLRDKMDELGVSDAGKSP